MPEDMPDRMPEDMPGRMPEDMPDRMPEDMSDRTPDRMSDRMPEDMPDKMPEDMPDRMSDRMPEGMPDKVPERLPEHMPDRMRDRMSEDMPEDMPDRVPEDMPEHMPEDMPGRMPEDMPDRMPEDLPVTKRINVMVGITRSKVIWYFLYLARCDSPLQGNSLWTSRVPTSIARSTSMQILLTICVDLYFPGLAPRHAWHACPSFLSNSRQLIKHPGKMPKWNQSWLLWKGTQKTTEPKTRKRTTGNRRWAGNSCGKMFFLSGANWWCLTCTLPPEYLGTPVKLTATHSQWETSCCKTLREKVWFSINLIFNDYHLQTNLKEPYCTATAKRHRYWNCFTYALPNTSRQGESSCAIGHSLP